MPSITAWTRLESQPFQPGVEEGLAARIHDPLWLLMRQWQTGEFAGEDTGTPVSVRVRLERLALARYHAGPLPADGRAGGQRYDPGELPLEALVEQERVRDAPDPRLAAEAGLHFLALLSHHRAPELRAAYRSAYPLERPPSDDGLDPTGSRSVAVLAGRAPNGRRLYADLKAAGGGLPPQPPVPAARRERVLAAARDFIAWYEGLFAEPAEPVEPWLAQRLEYAFAVSARSTDGEVAVAAPEYEGGRLDWHDFDLAPGATLATQPDDPAPETVTRTAVPTPIRYRGMPAARWWEFEDAEVDFGRIDAAPDELLRLVLVEFALTYGNDWFIAPVELEPGALYRLRSVVVTDAFGERTLVPHYGAVDAPTSGFRLYALSGAAPDLLFLPPVVASTLSGPPVEEVLFLRDELANLAWAVEKLVPGPNGLPLDRYEAHVRRREASPPPADRAAAGEPAVYRLASTVPDYWIPLLPVRPDPDDPSIRLRRGRVLVDRGGEPVLPPVLGRVLAPERPLELFEEEVPRADLPARALAGRQDAPLARPAQNAGARRRLQWAEVRRHRVIREPAPAAQIAERDPTNEVDRAPRRRVITRAAGSSLRAR
jgi:hypothetical protein